MASPKGYQRGTRSYAPIKHTLTLECQCEYGICASKQYTKLYCGEHGWQKVVAVNPPYPE